MPDVILQQPHTHGGTPYRAGERITVDANAAQWLVELGIAQATPQPEPVSPPAKASAKPNPKTAADTPKE